MLGKHFRRQHQVGPYVVDFISVQDRLVIEVDGSQHFEDAGVARDLARTAYLQSLGLTVLRVDNHQVLTQTGSVLEVILQALSPLP